MGEIEKKKLVDYLNKNHVDYKLTTHKPTFTSEESAKIRNAELKSGVKALMFKIDKTEKYVIVLIRSDRRVDITKLSAIVRGVPKLAHTKELIRTTGCQPGSLHPFGNLWNIQVIMDNNFDVEHVNFNAGANDYSIHMRLDDLIRLTFPILKNIS